MALPYACWCYVKVKSVVFLVINFEEEVMRLRNLPILLSFLFRNALRRRRYHCSCQVGIPPTKTSDLYICMHFFIIYVLQHAIKSIKYNKVNEIEEGWFSMRDLEIEICLFTVLGQLCLLPYVSGLWLVYWLRSVHHVSKIFNKLLVFNSRNERR